MKFSLPLGFPMANTKEFKDFEQMKRNREIEIARAREMANFMARYFAAVRSSFFVTGEQE